MKKLILTTLMLLAFASFVNASPFLVCDPQAEAETYNVYQDGTLIEPDVAAEPDGSLKYDLWEVIPGGYLFAAEACNVWGCSDVSDPFVSPGGMSKPSNLNLIP